MRATGNNPYVFQMVKGGVDILEAARRYGLEPDGKGWCRCPFHNEKTASFHLHHQRYRCFGCGASGDVIDLVAGVRGIDPLEAVRELNAAFGLGVDMDAPADTAGLAKVRAERERRERFKSWREAVIRTISDQCRELHLAIVHEPERPSAAEISDHCAASMREIDKLEYYFSLAAFGDEDEVRAAAPVLNAVAERIGKEGWGR